MGNLPYYPLPKNQTQRSANLAYCEHHDIECCSGCFRKVANIRWKTPKDHTSRFAGGAWYEKNDGQYCAECVSSALHAVSQRPWSPISITEKSVVIDTKVSANAAARLPIRPNRFMPVPSRVQHDTERTQRETVRVELCFPSGHTVATRMPGFVGVGTKMQLIFVGKRQYPVESGWFEVKAVKKVGLLERLPKSAVETKFILTHLSSMKLDQSKGFSFVVPVR
jgi:hypothetical protein